MTKKPSRFTFSEFKRWLTRCGAIIEPPLNKYEVLRVDSIMGVDVIYANDAGVNTWPPALLEIRRSYMAGRAMRLSPALKIGDRYRHKIQEIADRDGLLCWFCDLAFRSINSDEITIEHLLARCHGGSDHASNLVLACDYCNGRVGILSISEKVAMRPQLKTARLIAEATMELSK